MTNGEKIQSIFPNMNFGTLAQDDVIVNKDYSNNDEPQVFIPIRVWNAEYKKPTTKNDLTVDCVDRVELLKAMNTYDKFGNDSNERLIFLSTPALQDRYVPYVHYDEMVKCVKGMPTVTPQEPKWIPIKTRKLTDAEEQDMLENSNYFYNYMFDCQLPEDGEEVLVTTSTGEVTTTTFYDEGLDGCCFEFYEDDGDVIAWMPKPKSYKAESE